MKENILDIIGGIIWLMMFIAPFVSVIVVWRNFEINKIFRVVIGIIIGFFISLLFYVISLEIIFRDGMGPV